MNNFKFYVQELRKLFRDNHNLDYTLVDEEENKTVNYLIPVKASSVKERRENKRRVVTVHRSSDAYGFFVNEYRGNKLSEDSFGNILVPESDYYATHKTR